MGCDIVVVGASLGGFDALKTLLGALPRGFELPLAVVLHRDSRAGGELSALLQRHCALPVTEPDDKDPISGGQVAVAPGDYHLLVERGHFALSTGPLVCYARPSIDVLFEAAADAYGAGVVGVILTGMGHDGAAGLASIKERGGQAIVQDPATARGRALPDAALASTPVDQVLPVDGIARLLAGLHSGLAPAPSTGAPVTSPR